jgi:hypothetical protein
LNQEKAQIRELAGEKTSKLPKKNLVIKLLESGTKLVDF